MHLPFLLTLYEVNMGIGKKTKSHECDNGRFTSYVSGGTIYWKEFCSICGKLQNSGSHKQIRPDEAFDFDEYYGSSDEDEYYDD